MNFLVLGSPKTLNFLVLKNAHFFCLFPPQTLNFLVIGSPQTWNMTSLADPPKGLKKAQKKISRSLPVAPPWPLKGHLLPGGCPPGLPPNTPPLRGVPSAGNFPRTPYKAFWFHWVGQNVQLIVLRWVFFPFYCISRQLRPFRLDIDILFFFVKKWGSPLVFFYKKSSFSKKTHFLNPLFALKGSLETRLSGLGSHSGQW